MQTTVEVHIAQKYRISDKNDKEVFDFLKQNFDCNRKICNLCVDSLYVQKLDLAPFNTSKVIYVNNPRPR